MRAKFHSRLNKAAVTENDWRWLVKQDRQCTYNETLRRVSATIVAVEKQWVLHNLSVRICSLWYLAGNRHVQYCRLWPASLYSIFPHYVVKGTIFEKVTKYKMHVFFSLQLLSETFLILRINERDMIKIYIGLHIKYPLFFSDFNGTWIFSTEFRKILKYKISWKYVQWERSCSMLTERTQTDMTKLIVAFRNFATALKIIRNCYCAPSERSGSSQKWNTYTFGGTGFSISQKIHAYMICRILDSKNLQLLQRHVDFV
jgi:hypothetical protein